jgi:hypothetical protein
MVSVLTSSVSGVMVSVLTSSVSGVMVSVITSSAVDCGFEHGSGQIKDL